MDLLEVLKETGKSEDFEESKNYYFQRHICKADGKERKVNLDFCLENDITDKALRFGICPGCGKVFYHRDFKSGKL
ncbi:MAG: hypothetical protein LUC97_06975 [Clostridiales bacterium]|nr:hypothetical protein [Clostridiales bacterium]MCD8215363.1 hypothetical protein [Clostridiales bacterium]